MTGVGENGISFGKVTVDQTGRTKIAQKVEGIDLGELFQDMRTAKMAPLKKHTDTVKLNNEKIAALEDFKAKVLTLNTATASLTNNLNGQNGSTPNLMEKKTFSYSSSNSIPANNLLGMDIYASAKTGSFNMKVNQIASADSYSTQITTPNFTTPLGLDGVFNIGTTSQGTTTAITITPDMTLDSLTTAINNASGQSKVTASYNVISFGSNSTYELRLQTKQLSTPLVLQDTTGSVLQELNLLPAQAVRMTSGSIATDINANLNLNGNLVISAGTGTPVSVDLNGRSLQNVMDQINTDTLTTNVAASLMPIYPPNALSSTPPSGYCLRLVTTDPTHALNFSDSTAGVLNSLQLHSAVAPSLNSMITTANSTTDQGITGNLIVQAGPTGTSQTIDTAGKSIETIITEINQNTATTGISAKLQIMVNADPSSNNPVNVCQLTLTSNNGESVLTGTSDATALNGLGLTAPIKDYQGMLAKINVDGTDYQRASNSIYNVVKGVTFNLQNANTATTITVNVTEDKQSIMEGLDNFINIYNDLNTFYNKQTAMKSDFSGPEEGALLTDVKYVTQFMKELQRNMCAPSSGSTGNSLNSLMSIGLQLNLTSYSTDGKIGKADGSLRLDPKGGEERWTKALNSQIDELVSLFGNTVKNTNADFAIIDSPFVLDADFIGQDMTITIANDSNGVLTATAVVKGLTYIGNVSVVGGRPTVEFKGMHNCLDKFKFQYNKPLANSTSASTTYNITPGIMAKVNGAITHAVDPNMNPDKKLLPPLNINGPLLQAIEKIKQKNQDETEKTKKMEQTINKQMASFEASFSRVSMAQEKYNTVKMLLDGFQAANKR